MAKIIVKREKHKKVFIPVDCSTCGSTIQFDEGDMPAAHDYRDGNFYACPVCGVLISERKCKVQSEQVVAPSPYR